MWEKPNQFLYPVNNLKWHERLVRMKGQPKDLHFAQTGFPGNLHPLSALSSNKSSVVVRSKVKMLHYGTYDRTLRQQKYEFYNKHDPNNTKFNRYRKILSEIEEAKVGYLPEGEFIPGIT